MKIDAKYKPLMLEALEELMYKLSMQLDELKGEPLGKWRKELTQKQTNIEELQHIISTAKD